MEKRRNILKNLLGFAGLGTLAAVQPKSAVADDGGLQLFFAFRDTVLNFDITSGIGDHTGTVNGAVTGTSMTNFQFLFTPTGISFDNRMLITDLSGDQMLFRVVGTGGIIQAPLSDSSPLGNLMSFGGPLTATFTVTEASGKFASLVGRAFAGKMIATNTSKPSAGALGNVCGEVYANGVGVLKGIAQK